MSAFTDFLTKLVLPTVEAAADAALDPLLDDLYKSKPADYVALVTSLNAGFSHLAPVVANSKSDILKGIVASLQTELQMNATKNGVSLIAVPDVAPTPEPSPAPESV